MTTTTARDVIKETRALGGMLPVEPAEDSIVLGEIQRHRLGARLIHWGVALCFVLCLGTGMPMWFPAFGWMATLFGGLGVCRWLHPWIGVGFAIFSLLMLSRWAAQMAMLPGEWAWIGPKVFEYLRFDHDDPNVGKYNGGQKIFFWLSALGMVGLFLTGFVLWWPEFFPRALKELAFLVHDLAFILFTMQLMAHVYLATAAEPGTFRAMLDGRVSLAWAKTHHARWHREVTGEKPSSGS